MLGSLKSEIAEASVTEKVRLEDLKGLVYNMQKFAIHDGPGIRTLVYMKGCPLRCKWCSAPESQKMVLELQHIELHCKKCGRCAEVCPVAAISLSEEKGVEIDRGLCTSCGRCVEACPNRALAFGDLEDPKSEVAQLLKKQYSIRRKPNLGTGPQVYYLV